MTFEIAQAIDDGLYFYEQVLLKHRSDFFFLFFFEAVFEKWEVNVTGYEKGTTSRKNSASLQHHVKVHSLRFL